MVAGPLFALTRWAPGMCRARLKERDPVTLPQARPWRKGTPPHSPRPDPGGALGGVPAWLTQGPTQLTLNTGVSSEARGTGAGPLSRITGSSILTLALLGTVLAKGAVGASWDGGREAFAKSVPVPPRLWPTGLRMDLSHPEWPLGSHILPTVTETVPGPEAVPHEASSLGRQAARKPESKHPSTSEDKHCRDMTSWQEQTTVDVKQGGLWGYDIRLRLGGEVLEHLGPVGHKKEFSFFTSCKSH